MKTPTSIAFWTPSISTKKARNWPCSGVTCMCDPVTAAVASRSSASTYVERGQGSFKLDWQQKAAGSPAATKSGDLFFRVLAFPPWSRGTSLNPRILYSKNIERYSISPQAIRLLHMLKQPLRKGVVLRQTGEFHQ